MSVLSDELALPAYSGTTAEEAANLLNAKTIATLQSITTHDIEAYLVVIDKYLAIIDSTDVAARRAVLALSKFDSFDVANPAYLSALTIILDGLVTAALISTDDKTAILALGDTMTSRVQELKLGYVRIGHVIQARANS